jgi:serine phosphatase RsbU (regulator of sigma subunit)
MKLFALILSLLSPFLLWGKGNVIRVDEQTDVLITNKLSFLADSSKCLNAFDALTAFNRGQFDEPKIDAFKTINNYWMGLRLKNVSKSIQSYIVISSGWDFATFYVFSKDSLLSSSTVGFGVPVANRKIPYPFHNPLSIELLPNTEHILLIQVEDNSTVDKSIFNVGIQHNILFFKTLVNERYFQGIFFGIILIMFIYNIFIYLSIREKSYLLYSLTILGSGLIWLENHKIINEYILPNIEPFKLVGTGLFVSSFFGICLILFTQNFLETKIRHRKWHKAWNVVIVILVVIPFGYLILPEKYGVFHTTSFMLGLLVFFSILSVSLASLLKRFRPARYFFLANVSYSIGAIILILGALNAIPMNFFVFHSMQIGNIVEIAMFSFALADRINILKLENEQRQSLIIEQLKINETLNEKVTKELEQKVTERTAEISQQKEEILAQRDMLKEQYGKLELYNTQITDSLNYAQSIQEAIMPSEKALSSISNEYFVLNSPCDIVSGDFYWARSFGSTHVFCVADCTGHGVPGAFMSVLGITLLNDIFSTKRDLSASEILNSLRENVINALAQNAENNMHKDGMDMAICIFNSKIRELQYAGAKIPLWIITRSLAGDKVFTQTNFNDNEYSLYEVKADVMPVGTSPLMSPFTNKIYRFDSEVAIYLSTDGFADQPDEISRAKYKSRNLKDFILKNSQLPFGKQKDLLSKEFNRWKGAGYQIDDVTIMGIKL